VLAPQTAEIANSSSPQPPGRQSTRQMAAFGMFNGGIWVRSGARTNTAENTPVNTSLTPRPTLPTRCTTLHQIKNPRPRNNMRTTQ
jgi:hypothetical protein